MAIPFFKLYGKDFLALTYDLTDAQVGKLIKSMCRQSIGLEANVPENLKKIAESLIKNILDDEKKYQKKCEQNQRASYARWIHNEYQMDTRCNPNQNQNQNQNIEEDKKENSTKEKSAKPNFKKPTVEEIKAYCLERHNNVDAERFFDFYESKGWKIGRNSMKDWKSAIRTWEKSERPVINSKSKSSYNGTYGEDIPL